MNYFSFNLIFNILIIVIGSILLLCDLYSIFNHGNLIVKLNKNKRLMIVWSVLLIFWCLALGFNIKSYINNLNDSIFNDLLVIFWVEFTLSNIIKSFRGSEIRENGLYNSGYFYKWNKIQDHKWTSSNIIIFKVRTLFKNSTYLKFTINEEYKEKVNDVLQRKISSYK